MENSIENELKDEKISRNSIAWEEIKDIADTIKNNGYKTGIKVIHSVIINKCSYVNDKLTIPFTIIKPQPNTIKSVLGFKWDKSQSGLYVADIRTHNDELSKLSTWELKIYGQDFVKELNNLTKILSEKYEVTFNKELCEAQPRREMTKKEYNKFMDSSLDDYYP